MPDALDHRLLRQFVAVAHAGGLRAGASALNMSQPPLSRTIRELETALGVSLFERSKSGMTLTAEGSVLLEEAEAILAALSRAEARIKRMGMYSKPLRIGFVSAALDSHLPDLLSRISARGWPAPELIETPTNPQAKALARAELDLGLLHPPVDAARGLSLASLGEDEFLVALYEGHPLAERKAIRSADLANHPLVLFPRSQGPVLHAAIRDALAPYGELKIGAEAARSHTQLALIAAKVGIGLIGASVARTLDYHGVVLRPWVDRPKMVALQCSIMGSEALLAELNYT
ncbi:LysR family transcriptional regulator [Ruegeria jejuensis]|uniref:LysR substrate-binding domain-containing protein n=1 Tax=Ruegeria jejuensis TaxID=3233338 RepID=UPI00355B4347